jgi:hypothetical protein
LSSHEQPVKRGDAHCGIDAASLAMATRLALYARCSSVATSPAQAITTSGSLPSGSFELRVCLNAGSSSLKFSL